MYVYILCMHVCVVFPVFLFFQLLVDPSIQNSVYWSMSWIFLVEFCFRFLWKAWIFFICLRFLHTKVTIDYSKKHVFAVLSPSPPCNSELCVASLIIQKRTKFVCQKKKTQFVLNWTTRAKHFYALRIKPLVSTFISHLRFILLY